MGTGGELIRADTRAEKAKRQTGTYKSIQVETRTSRQCRYVAPYLVRMCAKKDFAEVHNTYT